MSFSHHIRVFQPAQECLVGFGLVGQLETLRIGIQIRFTKFLPSLRAGWLVGGEVVTGSQKRRTRFLTSLRAGGLAVGLELARSLVAGLGAPLRSE